MVLSTFVACLLPFFGDFISLTGSICMMPLDLVLVLALFVKVCYQTYSTHLHCSTAAWLMHVCLGVLLLL